MFPFNSHNLYYYICRSTCSSIQREVCQVKLSPNSGLYFYLCSFIFTYAATLDKLAPTSISTQFKLFLVPYSAMPYTLAIRSALSQSILILTFYLYVYLYALLYLLQLHLYSHFYLPMLSISSTLTITLVLLILILT